MLRFPHERRPGIPMTLALDEKLARLLGYYCAEGSVVQNRKRPNSYLLNFSFSPQETERVDDVRRLLRDCLGVESSVVRRTTTLAIACGKTSVALLFKRLAGSLARNKRVPTALFDAHRSVIEAFVESYRQGDGHRAGAREAGPLAARDVRPGVG